MLRPEALLFWMIHQLAGMEANNACISPPRNSRMWLPQYSYLNYCNVPTFSGCLLSITLCASTICFVYFVFNTQNEHFFCVCYNCRKIHAVFPWQQLKMVRARNSDILFQNAWQRCMCHGELCMERQCFFVFIFLWLKKISKQFVTFALL